MDFVTDLPISTNWKGDSYDSILLIVNELRKMVYYKPVKITIDAPGLIKVIIDVVVWHHNLPILIVTNWGFLFTLKFWSLLCYFHGIKCRLSIAFHPQIDRQTERQNSTWGLSSKFLSTLSRITGPGFYRYLGLYTIMPKTPALVRRHLNSTAAIILAFLLSKTPILASNQKRPKNYPDN